jgi:hypothetical protein
VSDIGEVQLSTNVSLLGMLSLKLGRSLAWDGERETVSGDDEANRLLTRPYRGAWQYPQA